MIQKKEKKIILKIYLLKNLPIEYNILMSLHPGDTKLRKKNL